MNPGNYVGADAVAKIKISFSQQAYLKSIFGGEADWSSIAQSVFNSTVNMQMIHTLQEQSGTSIQADHPRPERAENPLLIPRDKEGNLVEPEGCAS
jgi:hypothetical protein